MASAVTSSNSARTPRSEAKAITFSVYEDNSGRFGWRLLDARDTPLARSAGSFSSRTAAQDAATEVREALRATPTSGRHRSPRERRAS